MLKKIAAFDSSGLRQLKIIAEFVSKYVGPGDCVGLRGELGAGKTTMASFLIKNIIKNTKVTITSPTFNIINTYFGNGFEVWHCDLYRINRPEDTEAIGLFDALHSDAVLIIEWPDIIAISLPDTTLFIDIDAVYGRNIKRTVTFFCRNPNSKWNCLAEGQGIGGLIEN